MKKFLSVVLALLMVVSVLALAGCKKDPGTEDEEPKNENAELFIEAYKQMLFPKIAGNFIDTDALAGAKSFGIGLDEFKMESMGEVMELPEIDLEFIKTGDKSFDAQASLKAGEDVLNAVLTVEDFKKFYVSVPAASKLYITGTIEDLLSDATLNTDIEDSEGNEITTQDTDTIKAVFGVIVDAFEKLDDILFTEENITSETVEAEVFGEKLSLNKLTLKLDTDDLASFAVDIFDSLPEDIKAELNKELDEGKTLEEELTDTFKGSGNTYDVVWSFYLDGKDVRKMEMGLDANIEGDKVAYTVNADVLNTADTYKHETETKMVFNGEEVAVKAAEEFAVKDGKITGEMTSKPEFDIPETEENAEVSAMLQDMEISAEYEGTVTDKGFDIEIENEISMGGMAFKLPATVKGERSDKSLSIDMDASFNLMGMMDIAIGLTGFVSNEAPEYEPAQYIPENAVSVDDEEKLAEFGAEVEAYVEGLEELAAMFESFVGGEDEYDDSYSNMYTASNEYGSFDFYSDGTGTASTYCDLTVNEDEGTFTIIDADGFEHVITLTGDDTADVNGIAISYECFAAGGSAETYVFDIDGAGTEIWITPYVGYASLEVPFEYTDSVIIIDDIPVEYTVDETEFKMTIGGIEYEIDIPIYEG